LLAEKRVQPEPAKKQELDDLRALVQRNLDDAALTALSSDGRFSMAYNGVRALATIAVRAAGYRVKATGGGHYNTFVAMEAAMGAGCSKLAAYFDTCRQKRNDLNYDAANLASDTEVEELLRQAVHFRQIVESWIHQNHPSLA